MDDLKSAVHHLKSFALDAAQEGWPLVRVARGKHHLTLDIFYMQFWGIERGITPLAKKKVFGELKICILHPFSFKIFK